MNYYVKAFKNYAKFEGRATRPEFWYFALFNFLIIIGLGLIDYATGMVNETTGYGLLTSIYGIAILIPALAVGARRLHDTGKTGWLQAIGFIPLIGPIIMIVLYALKGDEGENQYGPAPRGDSNDRSDSMANEPQEDTRMEQESSSQSAVKAASEGRPVKQPSDRPTPPPIPGETERKEGGE